MEYPPRDDVTVYLVFRSLIGLGLTLLCILSSQYGVWHKVSAINKVTCIIA